MKKRTYQPERKIKRISKAETECVCTATETKIEDYTHRFLGQEATRKIMTTTCLNCGEKSYDGKPLLEMEAEIEAKVIALANERLNVPRSHRRSRRSPEIYRVPEGHTHIRYFDEVDLLFIRFGDKKCARTEDAASEDLIYNFDENDNLVSIEIIDFYDKYEAYENDENRKADIEITDSDRQTEG